MNIDGQKKFFQSNPLSKITWFDPSRSLTIFGLFLEWEWPGSNFLNYPAEPQTWKAQLCWVEWPILYNVAGQTGFLCTFALAPPCAGGGMEKEEEKHTQFYREERLRVARWQKMGCVGLWLSFSHKWHRKPVLKTFRSHLTRSLR